MPVTPLQAKMLIKIAESEFSTVNGAVPAELEDVGDIWADVIVEDAEDKGTFTSLMNAGLAGRAGKGRDTVVWLTQAGFDAYLAAK